MIDQENQQSYFSPQQGKHKALEVLCFARRNQGLVSIIDSLAQRYMGKAVTSSGTIIDMSARLLQLQSLFNGRFAHCVALEGAVKQHDQGIGVTLAIPKQHQPVNLKQVIRGGCTIPAACLDIGYHPQSPLSTDPHQVYIKSGVEIVVAAGTAELDTRARIKDVDMDGIRLFINDDGTCYGLAAALRATRLALTQKPFTFNDSHNGAVAELKTGLESLSFLDL